MKGAGKKVLDIIDFITFLSHEAFVAPTYIFFVASKVKLHRPRQFTSRENFFHYRNIKFKIPTLAGKKELSMNLVFHRTRKF